MTLPAHRFATVNFGSAPLEGAMMPDGTFYVSVASVANLFQLSRDEALGEFKKLLGDEAGFIQFTNAISGLDWEPVDFLRLTDLEKLVVKLDRAGNVAAQGFRDSMVRHGMGLLAQDSHS